MAYFASGDSHLKFWLEYIFLSLYLIQKNINFISFDYQNSKILKTSWKQKSTEIWYFSTFLETIF